MATTAFFPEKGNRGKVANQQVLGDADDNATAIVTIPKLGIAAQARVVIDEIVAGYNGTAASKNVTITRNAVDLFVGAITSGGLTVQNPKVLLPEAASYFGPEFDVTVTLDASGGAGTDGFVIVKFHYQGQA